VLHRIVGSIENVQEASVSEALVDWAVLACWS
jgi:hypothetical protein